MPSDLRSYTTTGPKPFAGCGFSPPTLLTSARASEGSLTPIKRHESGHQLSGAGHGQVRIRRGFPSPETCNHSPVDCWELANDPEEVHRLLLASDVHAAGGGHLPQRRPDSTRRLVSAGSVHGLRRAGRLVASVTLTEDPTFEPGPQFANVTPVLYMRRLCVDPAAGDPLLGLRAARRAASLAREQGFRALRSEVNPEVLGVIRMLTSFGFRQRGSVLLDSEIPAVQMELLLSGSDAVARRRI